MEAGRLNWTAADLLGVPYADETQHLREEGVAYPLRDWPRRDK